MTSEILPDSLLATWKTNNRVTTYLIENLPAALWSESVPTTPRRTVQTIAAHLHNSRCMWIKMIGKKQGVALPKTVDRRTVTRTQLVSALNRSSRSILGMMESALEQDGMLPAAAWQNYPRDVVHFLAYFVAHEAHHRGQIVMIARQLGQRLPSDVTAGLWQWNTRAREAGS